MVSGQKVKGQKSKVAMYQIIKNPKLRTRNSDSQIFKFSNFQIFKPSNFQPLFRTRNTEHETRNA